MSFQVTITLTTAGGNTGPFNIYQDLDSYVNPIATNVQKSDLIAGYVTTAGTGATIIRCKSMNGTCSNYVDLPIQGLPGVTPTPTPTQSPAAVYNRAIPTAGAFQGGNNITCGVLGSNVAIYLNSADFATWSSNGQLLVTGMTLYASAGVLYSYNRIYDPTATTIYNVISGVVGTVPSGGYC